MVVVSKAIFDKQAKGLAAGDTWGTERYASTSPNLSPLGDGGSLFMVTVRPGDALWLVAVLREPASDAEGWLAPKNTTAIRDVTALLKKLKFSTGKGVKADPGKLGMSLQTPRQLTDADVTLLDLAAPAKAAPPVKAAKPAPPVKAAKPAPPVKAAKAVKAAAAPAAPPPVANGETRLSMAPAVARWLTVKQPRYAKSGKLFGIKDQIDRVLGACDRCEPSVKDLAVKVRAWFADEARFSDKYDEDVQIAGRDVVARFNDAPDFPAEWVRAFGHLRAARMVLRLPILDLEGNWSEQRVIPSPGPGTSLIYNQVQAFKDLAELVPDLTVEQKAVLKRELHDMATTFHPSVLVAMADFLDDQTEIDAMAGRAADDPVFAARLEEVTWTTRVLVSRSCDADALEKLIVADPKRAQYGGALTLARALANTSPLTMKRALLAILPPLEDKASSGDFKEIVQVASCIDDAEIADFIARRAHVKNIQPIALEYFARLPHRMTALDGAAGERGKLGEAAKVVRDSVSRKASSVASAATSEEESMTGVPDMLASPRFASVKASLDAMDVEIPDEPSTHLRPGEYKQWVQEWHFQGVRDMATLRVLVASRTPAPTGPYLEGLLSIIGPEAIPLIAKLAARSPVNNVDLLLHLISPHAMVAIAPLLGKAREAPRVRAWMLEHADVAAKGLVPAAVGKDPKLHAPARAALAMLIANGKGAEVEAAAKAISVDLRRAAPDDTLPAPGKMPPFADAGALPAPVLTKTGAKLPRKAVANLLAVLSVLPKDATHPIMAEIKAACTQASLDEFVWTLVNDYILAGGNARNDWALFAAGHLGSDVVARKVDTAARKWVQKSVELMQKSLDVLALIGTDVALSLLYERGLAAKFEDTQTRARQILEQIAGQRGISYEELEDRLVPELGLDDGPLTLDYGARSFEVKLDEQLTPFVMIAGAREDKPPRAVKTDDAAKAKAAIARFATLSEDLSHVARTQLLRLERAMREGRIWEKDAWLREVVRHPLLRYVAARLVWSVSGTLVRVAEDGSLADDTDTAFMLPEDARACLAHPLDVEAEPWARMARLFADYEILQPFAQLSRETFDKNAKLTTWNGRVASWAAVDELLTGRGWLRTKPEGGTVRTLVFPFDRFGVPQAHAALAITPGLTIGPVKARPAQTVDSLSLVKTTLDALPPRVASEVLRDVAALA